MYALRAVYCMVVVANALFALTLGSALLYFIILQTRPVEGQVIIGAMGLLYAVHVICVSYFEMFDAKLISWWPVPEALFGRSPFWLRFVAELVLCALLGWLISLFLPTWGEIRQFIER